MSILHLAILSPLLVAMTIPLLSKVVKGKYIGWLILLVPLVLFIYLLGFIPEVQAGTNLMHEFAWVPTMDIYFNAYVDGLGLLFALLITGMGVLVILYAIFYLSEKEKLHNFYTYLMMFMGAMLGVVLSDHLIVLYIFWELTSLSSALLIAFWFKKDRSVYGARKSMLITVFGGFAMLAGFSMLYVITGTFSIQGIIGQVDLLKESLLFYPAMLLVLVGAFTKSAQFPFHIWLPDAMQAPTPVSAYLHSATMVKAGIYLVARLTPVFGVVAEWSWILIAVGLVTLMWGSVSATRQIDLKAILAYSTISQLGLLMVLLGIGSKAVFAQTVDEQKLFAAAILTAILHIVNHATFKGSLFMIVGIIDHETGTRDIRKLGGLMSIMPITFTVSLVGLAAMAGIPPFNGFISKEMFFTGLLSVQSADVHLLVGVLVPIIGWIASVFTFLYCFTMLLKTFTGEFDPKQFKRVVHEAPVGLLISPIVLGILVVLLGLFPNVHLTAIIEPAVSSVLPHLDPEVFRKHLSLWHGVNMELLMSIAVVGVGYGLYRIFPRIQQALAFYQKQREPLHKVYDRALDGLYDGSVAITRMQMTGRLRDYLVFMLVFIIGILAFAFYRSGSFAIPYGSLEGVAIYNFILIALLMTSSVAMLFVEGRMTFIMTLGVVGIVMSLLFATFSAPDLALTQLLVETVTVILLLLAFRHLPKMSNREKRSGYKMTNVLISIAAGVGVVLIGMSALVMKADVAYMPVSDFFVKNAYTLGGGMNMVNVILVDFRALDTILEAAALGVVGLAVVMLIKHRFKGGEDL